MAAPTAVALLFRGALGARALSTAAEQLWVTGIKYRSADKVLDVEFSTGDKFSLPAEYLRAESPAAEARDRAGRPKVVGGRRHVGILGIHPVGSYAVRLEFDDLHSSGIYTWPYLLELGQHKLSRMRQYIRALRERGLSRDPPRLRARRGTAAGQQQQQQVKQQAGQRHEQQDERQHSGSGGGAAGGSGGSSGGGRGAAGGSSGSSGGGGTAGGSGPAGGGSAAPA